MLRSALTAVLTVGALTGCACKSDLHVAVSPEQRTLAVGESFTPTVRFAGCGGRRTLRDDVRWHAQDTTIVRVDPRTGRTTGLRAGTTTVTATGRRHGEAPEVRVTVRAAALAHPVARDTS